ncbi:hypothetical protein ACIQJT_38015 [Streptomyces sp. NPDC091972]|uniref:hypothetical protein n=1 Tax=unclassified Streptomyces TaxID=2593676 RepID=UPI00343188C0
MSEVALDLDVEAGTAVDVAMLGCFRSDETLVMEEIEGRCEGFVVCRLPGADTAAHRVDAGPGLSSLQGSHPAMNVALAGQP